MRVEYKIDPQNTMVLTSCIFSTKDNFPGSLPLSIPIKFASLHSNTPMKLVVLPLFNFRNSLFFPETIKIKTKMVITQYDPITTSNLNLCTLDGGARHARFTATAAKLLPHDMFLGVIYH